MIVLDKIGLDKDSLKPIHHWEVWFQTPKGLCKTLDQAMACVSDVEVDACFAIRPVPVAVSESFYEVIDR